MSVTLHPTIRVVDSTGAPVTGDASNLTLEVVTDGVAAAYAGSITEVADGEYKLVVTRAGTMQSVVGTSITDEAIVISARWVNPTDAGTGAASVTLTVKTDETPPVVVTGASVTVPGAGTKATDALGETDWNLDDGSYTVTIRSSDFYTPAASYTVVVAGGVVTSPAGGILEVTPQTIAEPADPTLCRCYIYMRHSKGGAALEAGEGTLYVSKVVKRPTAATVVYDDDSNADAPASTDASGFVYLDLPQGMIADLTATWPDGHAEPARITVGTDATQDVSGEFQATVPGA